MCEECYQATGIPRPCGMTVCDECWEDHRYECGECAYQIEKDDWYAYGDYLYDTGREDATR
mgnify:CR=1 FL=1